MIKKIWNWLEGKYWWCYRTQSNVRNETKWAWQRVFRGYDDRARWGLYGTITDIALPVLKEYRKREFGYPGMIIRKGSTDEQNLARWNACLDKMIASFEFVHMCEYDFVTWKDQRKNQKMVDEGLYLFAKYFQCLWD